MFQTLIISIQNTIQEWRVVYWISFGIFVVTVIIYGIWGSGEVQSWNDRDEDNSLRRFFKRFFNPENEEFGFKRFFNPTNENQNSKLEETVDQVHI